MRIEVRNVRKSYGSVEALRGASFQVESGRKVALIGPNGSGKSTLIRVLMGLIAYRGEVRLDGLAPFRDRVAVARRMAYVPQTAPLMRATVREVVRTVCQTRGIDRRDVVEAAGDFELDLDEIAGRPVRGLSGGMRHKLLIALALAARADFLVLDEPTASLDPRNRARFLRRVAEQAADATVLLCSHRLEEVQHLVDRVLELDDGRVAFDGPAGEFLAARSLGVLEVQALDGKLDEWLAARGFAQGLRGLWTKTVDRREKLDLLGQIAERIDGAVANVTARDLETIDQP